MSSVLLKNIGTIVSGDITAPILQGDAIFVEGGKIKKVGLVEVPMGTTLRDIIFGVGEGIRDDLAFKAVQTGGPSGGVITEDHLDTPIDYEHLQELGLEGCRVVHDLRKG